MRAHDFAPLFKLEHMLKDVRLALAEAQAAGAPFEFARAAEAILAAAAEKGHAQDDFCALVDVLEQAAGATL